MSGRPWDADADEFLRLWHGQAPAAELARVLDRTPKAVHQRANSLGLVRPNFRWTPAADRFLRAKSRAGWSDTEIAAALGCDRHTASARRKGMGLPGHYGVKGCRWHARGRAKVAAGVRRQCEGLGLDSLTQLRTAAYRRFARECGWPEELAPREVQILNLLAERGPMTRLELTARIGMRTDRRNPVTGQPAVLKSNGPGGTYTADLIRRGLVAYLHRSEPSGRHGVGRVPGLYTLTAHAVAVREGCLGKRTEDRRGEGADPAAGRPGGVRGQTPGGDRGGRHPGRPDGDARRGPGQGEGRRPEGAGLAGAVPPAAAPAEGRRQAGRRPG